MISIQVKLSGTMDHTHMNQETNFRPIIGCHQEKMEVPLQTTITAMILLAIKNILPTMVSHVTITLPNLLQCMVVLYTSLMAPLIMTLDIVAPLDGCIMMRDMTMIDTMNLVQGVTVVGPGGHIVCGLAIEHSIQLIYFCVHQSQTRISYQLYALNRAHLSVIINLP